MTGVRFVIIPLLLFLFFLTPFIKADDHCQEGKCQTYALDIYGDAIEDSDLVGHVIHVCTTINPILCFTWCVDDCRCLSFNYKEKNEGNICELNEGSHFTNQSSLKNSPRSRYYNLRREISRQENDDGDVTCVSGCCKNNPCQNGGSCTEICEPTSVRYNCFCSENFMGRHCVFERKSCQAYKAAGKRKSAGFYTIIDDSNQYFQVFCDFYSEPGFAWNLIQSFSLSQKQSAQQLVDYPHDNGLEFVFAGGREEMMSRNDTDPEYPKETGERLDGRNLINEWVIKHSNSLYVWNKTAFDQIDVEKTDHVMGLFELSHMNYEVDRENDTAGEPSIAEMAEKAIQILRKNPRGYFLLVEAARVDHGHHAGKAVRAMNDAVAMAKAVEKAVSMISKDDTLIIATADYSHVFTVGGYPKRGNPIFGLVTDIYDNKPHLGSDEKPYTTLGYANGLGGVNASRENLTGVDTTDKDFLQQATVMRYKETHGIEDVGIYADGPGAYLFHGVVEQQYIFHVMDHALCLSDSKQETCDKHVTRGGPVKSDSSKTQVRKTKCLILTFALVLMFF